MKSKSPKRKPQKKEPIPRGRPSGYRPEFVDQARKLCELGATERDLADFFKVSLPTLQRWRVSFPDFCASLKTGKYIADDRVEMSLYHRAIGYSFESEKIFNHQGKIVRAKTIEHVPPDTTAMIFWLKNRRTAQWRDRQEQVNLDVHMSLAELVNASYRQDLPAIEEPRVIEHEEKQE